MTNAPFFIVGASRSGTTMLRLILNAHSRLGVPDELKVLNTAARTLGSGVSLTGTLPDALYRTVVRTVLDRRRRVFEAMDVEALEAEILAHPARTLGTPYRLAAEAWASHYGKARWGEKTPQNLYYADVLRALFPDARFILAVRDPRAVVASMNRIEYFSQDTVLNALNVRRAMGDGIGAFTRTVPAERRTVVRYEDLVADPERWTRTLCTFLGEAFEPEMLAFHRDAADYMDPVIRTPAVVQPVSEAHTDKWRRTLSPSGVATVEAICADVMATWGYVPSGATLPLPGRVDRLMKQTYWTWKGWQHRAERGYTVHYPALLRTRGRMAHLLARASA